MNQRRKFLKNSLYGAGLALGAPFFMKEALSLSSSKREWKNWFGNERCIPAEILIPNNLDELRRIVNRSKKMRVLGAGHSFSPLVPTHYTLLNTDRMNRVLEFDSRGGLVKVEGGIRLSDLNSHLDRYKLTLPTFGGIDHQSMAGLTCTATHGTGVQWGSFSDGKSVHAMELVLADGEVLKLDSRNSSQQNVLQAARVSLGALGVIRSLTFRVYNTHNLEENTRPGSLDDALLPDHYLTTDHYKFYYFPFTDTTYMMFQNRTEKPVDDSPVVNWFENTFLARKLLDGVFKAFSYAPQEIPNALRLLTKVLPKGHRVNKSYKIMIQSMPPRSPVMEFAIPAAKAKQAIEIYQNVVENFSLRAKDPYFANFPIVVRFARGDIGNLLSHAQGFAPYCFIDFTAHPAIKGWQEFFKVLEESMIRLGGRPHWGKIFFRNPKGLYPSFEKFNEIRQNLDPTNKFANQFIEKLIS